MKNGHDGRTIAELHRPETQCRWCSRPLLIVSGIATCFDCDAVHAWLTYRWPR